MEFLMMQSKGCLPDLLTGLHCLQCPAYMGGCWFESWLLQFLSSSMLMHTWERQRCPKSLGSCTHLGIVAAPGIWLGLSQDQTTACIKGVNQPIEGAYHFLSNTVVQMNRLFLKMNIYNMHR